MKGRGALLSLCAALALVPAAALAKRGTIGVYAIVEQVELLPDERLPERVRIHGVFVVPVPMSSGDYQAPRRGCLYFSLPVQAAAAAVTEWRRLSALTGTGQVIGFAQYWEPDPADPQTFRALQVQVYPNAAAAVATSYPMRNARGVAERGDEADPDFDAIAARLRAVAAVTD